MLPPHAFLNLPAGVRPFVGEGVLFLAPEGGIDTIYEQPRFEVRGAPGFVGHVASAVAALIASGEVTYIDVRCCSPVGDFKLRAHASSDEHRERIWSVLHAAGVHVHRWTIPWGGDRARYGIIAAPAGPSRLEAALRLLHDEHECHRVLLLSPGEGPEDETRALLRGRAELVVERVAAEEPDRAMARLESEAITIQVARPSEIAQEGQTFRPCVVADPEPLGLFAALVAGSRLDPFDSPDQGPRLFSPGALDSHGLVLVVEPGERRVAWREIEDRAR